MKQLLIAGASIVALGVAPSLAQDSGLARGDDAALDYPCTCGSATAEGLTSADIRGRANTDDIQPVKDGSVRDAMGDPPVNPMAEDGRSAAFASSNAMPFPPQDVSDNDLEPYGREYPSGPPREARANRPEGAEGHAFTEGEVTPEGIRRYQGPDMWEADDETDVDSDEGPSRLSDKDSGRDRQSGGTRFEEQAGRESAESGSGEHSGDRTAAIESDAREQRSLGLARRALRMARYAVPDVRFRTYEFEIDDGRRVIEVAGVDLESGRRVEVDVDRGGRARSISAEIPIEEVPERIRERVTTELNGFEFVHALRTLRRGMDLSYEFAGFAGGDRPVTVEIGADGRGLTVRHVDRS